MRGESSGLGCVALSGGVAADEAAAVGDSFFSAVALVSSTTLSRDPVTYTVIPLQPSSQARKYALATSGCTGAMHMSLLALGIGRGDEVIVPDITWVATANAVLYTGATPVFADVEPDTWCLDPASFESKITSRTKAVMPVHLYGHPAHMGRIMQIARAHKLKVV